MENYKYILWVGGVANYHHDYHEAVSDYWNFISEGYDDVQIENIENEEI
jgi:hypothetical protein